MQYIVPSLGWYFLWHNNVLYIQVYNNQLVTDTLPVRGENGDCDKWKYSLMKYSSGSLQNASYPANSWSRAKFSGYFGWIFR